LASGVCYGTQDIESSWSWRLPCALQAVFSIGCAAVLWFTPESPRWLAYHGKESESLAVLASIYADGDESSPEVLQHHGDIIQSISWEKTSGRKLTYLEMIRTANARKRIMLCISVAVIGMMSGKFFIC
jgi:Sugar (and other) transporter